MANLNQQAEEEGQASSKRPVSSAAVVFPPCTLKRVASRWPRINARPSDGLVAVVAPG
jgi:hypothetical protein